MRQTETQRCRETERLRYMDRGIQTGRETWRQ